MVVLLSAVSPTEPVLERLDPPKRTFAIMAIIFISITGLLLVTCTMLGANWVRRLARHTPRPPRTGDAVRTAAENQRLRESLQTVLPQVDGKETIHMNRSAGETKADP